jgi:hypothetical protein
MENSGNNISDIDFELSKRGNIRKFNYKIEEDKIDLNVIFPFKNNMNNNMPDIIPQANIDNHSNK